MPRHQPRRRRIGHLDVLEVAGAPDGPTVVLFHGYGADMNDLASLAGVLQAPRGTNWIFPNGHLSISLGEHFEGRAWFPISVSELDRSMATGQAIDFSQLVPPGLKRAREMVLELIEKLGVSSDQLVLGGFSQGAMLALDVSLRMATPPAGLALLSGTLVNVEEWRTLASRHTGLRYFQSHGRRDTVLSFAMAQRLETVLHEAGWQGRLQAFEGGHEIPPEVMIQLGAYLRGVLS
jgi:phospholipase/carboxylesterase